MYVGVFFRATAHQNAVFEALGRFRNYLGILGFPHESREASSKSGPTLTRVGAQNESFGFVCAFFATAHWATLDPILYSYSSS